MIWLLLGLNLSLQAAGEDWNAGLSHLNKAQQSYFKSDYVLMHSEIIHSLKSTQDSVNHDMALKWARVCYSSTPKIELEDFKITFILRRQKRNQDSLAFIFAISAYIPRSKQVTEIDVLMPDGRVVEILGSRIPQKDIYPRVGTQDLVYQASSLPVVGNLPSGVYEFRLREVSKRVLKIPFVLWPDHDEATLPQVNYDPKAKSVQWTMQENQSADLYLYEGPALRPIWSKGITPKTFEKQGALAISPSPTPRRFEMLLFEPIFRGSVSLLYTHSRQVDIQ